MKRFIVLMTLSFCFSSHLFALGPALRLALRKPPQLSSLVRRTLSSLASAVPENSASKKQEELQRKLQEAFVAGDSDETIKSILEEGASMDYRDEKTGETLLHWAVRNQHDSVKGMKLIRRLREFGAPNGITSKNGFTPLALAISLNRTLLLHSVSF